METWQDLYRRAYWEERRKDEEFWQMIREVRDKTTVLIPTAHGTFRFLTHDLFQ